MDVHWTLVLPVKLQNEYGALPDIEIDEDNLEEMWKKWELRSSRSF